MKKNITENQLIETIKCKFPDFIPYWENYIKEWGNNQGMTIQIFPFSDYVIDVIKSNNELKINKIFMFVENLLSYGDESVRDVVATSFLEYLLSKDPNEIQFYKFSKFLGKHTIGYCRAWDEFTGHRTKGLWDE